MSLFLSSPFLLTGLSVLPQHHTVLIIVDFRRTQNALVVLSPIILAIFIIMYI